jgi:hypothetical protein
MKYVPDFRISMVKYDSLAWLFEALKQNTTLSNLRWVHSCRNQRVSVHNYDRCPASLALKLARAMVANPNLHVT